ncbi:MAG: hypothetical protein ABS79_00050 [Planctomycetes bacterium SCN 63-9]|nr:MAG: hypothetical protein ABS79_00050 [Planctomycetes bacterium SCN 63-9]
MNRLKSIDIAGWKSIRKTERPIELGPLNVLIGANGAGKSNLFSCLGMLRELANQRLPLYVGRAGGADALLHYGSKRTQSIEARCRFEWNGFEAEHWVELVYAAPDSLYVDDNFAESLEGFSLEESLKTPAIDESPKISSRPQSKFTHTFQKGEYRKEFGSFLDSIRVYHVDDTSSTARIRLTNSLEDDLHLHGDGGNLVVMLYVYQRQFPRIYDRIVSTIRMILPGFDDFVLEPERLNPRKILLRWRRVGSDYIFGPHQLSDGSLRAMVLITLLHQSKKDLPGILLLDEPEIGLHPHGIEMSAGLIRSASLKTQVLVATQSSSLLDHFASEEILVVDCLDGESKFSRLSSNDLEDWLKRYSIGELWEKNVVGGGPLR